MATRAEVSFSGDGNRAKFDFPFPIANGARLLASFPQGNTLSLASTINADQPPIQLRSTPIAHVHSPPAGLAPSRALRKVICACHEQFLDFHDQVDRVEQGIVQGVQSNVPQDQVLTAYSRGYLDLLTAGHLDSARSGMLDDQQNHECDMLATCAVTWELKKNS